MCIRDRLSRTVAMCEKYFGGTVHNVPGTEAIDTEPVSYTHLDVYKRQPPMISVISWVMEP